MDHPKSQNSPCCMNHAKPSNDASNAKLLTSVACYKTKTLALEVICCVISKLSDIAFKCRKTEAISEMHPKIGKYAA